jgi:hypothetical protein
MDLGVLRLCLPCFEKRGPAAGKERFGYTQWVMGTCNLSHEILELGGRTGADAKEREIIETERDDTHIPFLMSWGQGDYSAGARFRMGSQ